MQNINSRGNYLGNPPIGKVFRMLKIELLPKDGYGDFNYAVQNTNQ